MPTLKMMESRFALGEYGPQLWTRDRAREIRAKLVELLEVLGTGDVAVVDAKGVEVFDYSFANEFFGRTLLNLPNDHPGRFLVVDNLTGYTRENLEKALESLGLAITERKRGGMLELLGKVHPTDRETFKAIVTGREPITASALAERLSVNLTAMNERLSKLVGLGLVRRERVVSAAGRQQYQYSVLQ